MYAGVIHKILKNSNYLYDVAFPDDNSIAKIHKRDLTVMEE